MNKENADITWIGTLNIWRGMSSFNFWVKARPTEYAWKFKLLLWSNNT